MPFPTGRRKGWCTRLHIKTDNARFILLAVFLLLYMCLGAVFFMLVEGPNEHMERDLYYEHLTAFKDKYQNVLNITELDNLLYRHAEAFTAGHLKDKRQRWDFSGSFYFVGTVVSTIGFGMTTPRTVLGKAMVIAYGFLGCSGAILFFNLFLERIITFWALILRQFHMLRLKLYKERFPGLDTPKTDDELAESDSLDDWKPSVYKVQFLLLCTACTIASCASALYQPVENWTYFDAIYFCFVAFSTIGFGDYVVSQRVDYGFSTAYRLANFVFLLLGCCCIYSFFNVTSLVLRTLLDKMIKMLDFDCSCCQPKAKLRSVPPPPRSRRNAITEKDVEQQAKIAAHEIEHHKHHKRNSVDSTYDSDSHCSDELISMQDFLRPNKVHLVQMQKMLFDTAQRARSGHQDGFKGGVGPLAVVSQKFEGDLPF